MGVNRSTAPEIVSVFIRAGRIVELLPGGRSNIRVDEEMRDYQRQVCRNASTDKSSITRRPHTCQQPIKLSTAARTLNAIKLLRRAPDERNRAAIIVNVKNICRLVQEPCHPVEQCLSMNADITFGPPVIKARDKVKEGIG